MSISTLSPNSTFREWLTTTNTIIDTLNTSTLVAGQTVNGAFTIGSDSTSSLNVGGTLLVNTQSVVITAPTTLTRDVSISNSAQTFTVSTSGNTALSSVNTTLVNSISFVVNSTSQFIQSASFSSNVQVTGPLLTVNTASVVNATIGTARITDAIVDTLTLTSSLVSNSLSVGGSTTISNSLSVLQNTSVGGIMNVAGPTILNSSLTVTGATTFTRLAVENVTSPLTCDSTLRVAGVVNALSSLSVSSVLSVGSSLSATGSTALANTLSVAGATTFANTVTVSGAATFTSAVAISGACAITGSLTSPAPATFGSSLTSTSLTTASASITGPAAVSGAFIVGNSSASGNSGTCRIVQSASSTYIQAGLNSTPGSVSNIIFSPISVAGTEWMRIAGNSGFVGIGTAAPTHRLTVVGDSLLNGALEIQRSLSFNWQTKSVNTVYYTDCDGFIVVVANIESSGGNNLRFTYFSDAGSATTPRGYLTLDQTTGPRYNSMMMPVQAGHRWSVVFTTNNAQNSPGGNVFYAIYYVPFGKTGASL